MLDRTTAEDRSIVPARGAELKVEATGARRSSDRPGSARRTKPASPRYEDGTGPCDRFRTGCNSPATETTVPRMVTAVVVNSVPIRPGHVRARSAIVPAANLPVTHVPIMRSALDPLPEHPTPRSSAAVDTPSTAQLTPSPQPGPVAVVHARARLGSLRSRIAASSTRIR